MGKGTINNGFLQSMVVGFCKNWTLIVSKEQIDRLNAILSEQHSSPDEFFTEISEIKYPASYPCLMLLEDHSDEYGAYFYPIYVLADHAKDLIDQSVIMNNRRIANPK